jgi:hypothetical protein
MGNKGQSGKAAKGQSKKEWGKPGLSALRRGSWRGLRWSEAIKENLPLPLLRKEGRNALSPLSRQIGRRARERGVKLLPLRRGGWEGLSLPRSRRLLKAHTPINLIFRVESRSRFG